ncbi:hypothetical protein [Exiguobacterium aurantiacum]|uniref:hypothetical protein n=1 Tax=Exiguobacterium aurantiacum TaxID=33987 RepID=UPI0038505CA8
MNVETNPNEYGSIVEVAYEDFKQQVLFWVNKIQSNDDIYDLAFFKIFVKFEKFLVITFKEYICGNGTSEYIPECKLTFTDISHFERLVKSNSRGSFIDYLNIMEKFSKEVFKNHKNPFDCIFADAELKDLYNKMRYLRNHIAHESSESKDKYHRFVLNQQQFQEPNEHLKKLHRSSNASYFTHYITAIEKAASVIKNPSPFL